MITTRTRPMISFCVTTMAAACLGRLLRMAELARQRRQLSALSDWQLRDLGLSRADVEAEASKPFWRV